MRSSIHSSGGFVRGKEPLAGDRSRSSIDPEVSSKPMQFNTDQLEELLESPPDDGSVMKTMLSSQKKPSHIAGFVIHVDTPEDASCAESELTFGA
eukprot:scaffold29351_cov52-Attheya_sp.AAC.3